ncbi:MAG: 3-oxoacyl-ACP reductase [Candidatus Marinimicrobia bacterium]|jgi:3-oxoacyl-[acyl-carrier protein] reductase|nr:3-oxoacyl-ACP reductase [Candidatus Neomarinimicrobiota bacterium]MEC7622136.1 SDR family oxidoreductase [Candidatus Neomarinimicrobiota bacterium]MEC7901502.1 SDR family oxidoreductase [Candidatus Neomarinimicrobiota bacterium]|tara:strand:+ start:726 stop:1466 length:741 start_codon:yes stop_codon:yes gene_type:complete
MKNNLSNKTILITGAAGGIGEALCTSFAEANGTIILHYNSNRDKAESLLQKLPGMHHRAIQCDLSNADQVNTMFSAIDHVDIVINNAAVVENHEIDSLSYQDWQDIWERTIGANLIGPANIMYLASKFMIKNGGGKFINISSRGAFRGEPSAPAYGASKAGLNSLGQSLAKALAKDRVFVYTIAPGFVDTERVKNLIDDEVRAQSPLNRVAKPQEIADTALWLATGDNEFLTGCIIDVNGASYLRS